MIKRLDKTAKGYDTKTLSQVLQQVKEKFPGRTNVKILSEANRSEETMVRVRDAVRMYTVVAAGSVTQYDLFPEFTSGDAQGLAGTAAPAPARKGK